MDFSLSLVPYLRPNSIYWRFVHWSFRLHHLLGPFLGTLPTGVAIASSASAPTSQVSGSVSTIKIGNHSSASGTPLNMTTNQTKPQVQPPTVSSVIVQPQQQRQQNVPSITTGSHDLDVYFSFDSLKDLYYEEAQIGSFLLQFRQSASI